jgi:hypothetical protein
VTIPLRDRDELSTNPVRPAIDFPAQGIFMFGRVGVMLAITLLGLVILGALVHGRHRQPSPALAAAPMQQEPPLMLWAWETPEDLSALNPQRAGVAFLAREVLLGSDLAVRPRYQSLRIAPGTWLIAVVRVETSSSFTPDSGIALRSARAIADAAQLPNVRALQIDFDATVSQRDFYLAVVRNVRADLPAGFPLSLTALVSWCGSRSWLHELQIDEAVPMFFRMGGPAATRASAARSQSVVVEPRCSGSIGLSTDENWPVIRPNQRVYMFRPGAWTQNDLARVNRFGYQGLRGPTSP